MAGGYKVGRECKLYVDEAGAGQGTYAAVGIVQNPTLNLGSEEAEVKDRSSDWVRFLRGLLTAELEIEMSAKIGDTNYEIFRDAFLAGTPIGIAMASGTMTTVGEEVFEADFIVTQFPLNQPISELSTTTVSLKLAANSSFTPSYGTVAA